MWDIQTQAGVFFLFKPSLTETQRRDLFHSFRVFDFKGLPIIFSIHIQTTHLKVYTYRGKTHFLHVYFIHIVLFYIFHIIIY